MGIPSRGIHGLREAGLSMSTAVIQVPFEIVQKWQEIVNIIAEIIHVPSALVMKVEPPNIKVFISSESNGNPYERDELAPLNTGLYCETVMKTRQSLLVPDALRDEEWKSNPDIKLGMISYLGFPVTWPDGQIFGTICVLDKKENSYSELYRKFVLQCRDVLQADLRALARLSGELTRSEAYLEEAQRSVIQGASAGGFPLARSFGQRKALEFLDTTSRLPSLWTWFFNALIRKIVLLYKRLLTAHPGTGRISIMNVDC